MKNAIIVVCVCIIAGQAIYCHIKIADWQYAMQGWQAAVDDRDTALAECRMHLTPEPTKTPTLVPTPVTSESTYEQDTMALTMAKEFVLKHVKYPSSTKFPMFHIDRERLSNGKYRITGKVDTPNDYGATLRYSYEVVLHKEGEYWYADSINVHQ